MRFLGVDPGSKGALCVYSPDASAASGLRWHFLDVPMIGQGGAQRLNAPALRDWLMRFSPDVAMIELVNPMPGQGSVSTGIFIGAARALEAVIACCGISHMSAAPIVWKKAIGVPDVPRKKGDTSSVRRRKLKEASRAHAVRLFPELGSTLAEVKASDRAEAALLAAFARKFTKV